MTEADLTMINEHRSLGEGRALTISNGSADASCGSWSSVTVARIESSLVLEFSTNYKRSTACE